MDGVNGPGVALAVDTVQGHFRGALTNFGLHLPLSPCRLACLHTAGVVRAVASRQRAGQGHEGGDKKGGRPDRMATAAQGGSSQGQGGSRGGGGKGGSGLGEQTGCMGKVEGMAKSQGMAALDAFPSYPLYHAKRLGPFSTMSPQ